jgi:hypothetical protein
VALLGCKGKQRSDSSQAQPPPQTQSGPQFLSDDETARCKQAALDAARSPAIWERFNAKRLNEEPLKLDAKSGRCVLDQQLGDSVYVFISTGRRFGLHPLCIEVKVARSTYEILGLREGFDP